MKNTIPDIGETVPEFTVLDSEGHPFVLSDALNDSMFLMLVFYRGHW